MFVLNGCLSADDTPADQDASVDGSLDSGFDAGPDAGAEAGVDASLDASLDAGFDATVDRDLGLVDAGGDLGATDGGDLDASGVDLGSEVGTDAGLGDLGPYSVSTSIQPFYEEDQSCTGIVPQSTMIRDVGATVPVSPGFTLFGVPAGAAFLSTNGTIHFGGTTVSGQNVALPDLAFPNLLAVNWAPFFAGAPAVCQRSTALAETYSWVSANPANKIDPALSFAARLHSVGTIDILLMTGGAAGGTIGLQGSTLDEVVSFPCGANCGPADFPVGTVISFVPSGWSGAPDLEPILTGSIAPLYPNQPLPPLPELRVANRGDFPSSFVLWRLLIDQPVAVNAYGLSTPVDGSIATIAPGATSELGDWFGEPPSFPAPGTYPAHLWLEVGDDDAVLGNNILGFQIEVIPFVGTISFITTSVPNAVAGAPYNVQLQASGAPSINFAGSSPWLSVSSGGLLSGTLPSPGNYPITIRASNDPAYEAASMTFVVVAE